MNNCKSSDQLIQDLNFRYPMLADNVLHAKINFKDVASKVKSPMDRYTAHNLRYFEDYRQVKKGIIDDKEQINTELNMKYFAPSHHLKNKQKYNKPEQSRNSNLLYTVSDLTCKNSDINSIFKDICPSRFNEVSPNKILRSPRRLEAPIRNRFNSEMQLLSLKSLVLSKVPAKNL